MSSPEPCIFIKFSLAISKFLTSCLIIFTHHSQQFLNPSHTHISVVFSLILYKMNLIFPNTLACMFPLKLGELNEGPETWGNFILSLPVLWFKGSHQGWSTATYAITRDLNINSNVRGHLETPKDDNKLILSGVREISERRD